MWVPVGCLNMVEIFVTWTGCFSIEAEDLLEQSIAEWLEDYASFSDGEFEIKIVGV